MKRADVLAARDQDLAAVTTWRVTKGGLARNLRDVARVRIVEVYDRPKSVGRFGREKADARVSLVEQFGTHEPGTEYEVAFRRILGTWQEKLDTEAQVEAAQQEYARQAAEKAEANQPTADRLNAIQIERGLTYEDYYGQTKPLAEFTVDKNGNLVTDRYMRTDHITRLVEALADKEVTA